MVLCYDLAFYGRRLTHPDPQTRCRYDDSGLLV